MMTQEAKRNKYRGLTRYIAENYNAAECDIEKVHAELQKVDRWNGVSINSVQGSISYLRTQATQTRGTGRKNYSKNGKAPRMPDVLVTIPLPKRQSATMTVQEAFVVFKVLKDLFADK